MSIHVKFVDHLIAYDGRQIQSLWAYRDCDLQGDSVVSFVGPCDVSLEHMVDLEDVKAQSRIYSRSMLHFIVEHFDMDLEKAVLRQRLLVVVLKEELERRANVRITRTGDDLFDGTAKLTVSIATMTPVSTKIHLGINIDKKDTPVETRGLSDYSVEPRGFACAVMDRYVQECESVVQARCKVRGVT